MPIEREPNSSQEINSKLEKEQISQLASAMAARNFEEQQRSQTIIAETTDRPKVLQNPLMKNAIILVSAQMYERFLTDPSTLSIDLKTLTTNIYADIPDKVFDEAVKDMQKDEEDLIPFTGAQFRSLCRAISESTITFIEPFSAESNFTKSLKQVEEARRIGAERGISPTDVYINDDLYAELIRTTQTPLDAAKYGIKEIKKATDKKVTKMGLDIGIALSRMMDEVTDYVEPPIEPAEFEDIMQEISQNPEFKKEIRKATIQYKQGMRNYTVDYIIRFWGQEALDSLPEPIKKKLIK